MFVRWQNLSVDRDPQASLPSIPDATVRTFDAPQALGVRFHEVRARSALNRVPPRSRMPFRWTVNPYRGCSHACVYCFARPTHTYLGLGAGRDFEREIVVKVNAPDLLRAELARPRWKQEHVALGTNTDPYQWVESRYRLMPGIWEALRDAANPCSLVTKSPLVLRDVELLREVAEHAAVLVFLSVPTIDDRAWRATEPHTPSPRARLDAVRRLNEAGVPAGVLMAPLMPGINDAPDQVEEILRLADESGAVSIGSMALHLRGEVRDIFLEWLRAYRPDLEERYAGIYRRGSYADRTERDRLRRLVAARRPGGRPSRPRTARADATPSAGGGPAPSPRGRPAASQSSLF
jgi:DNA repair photolyase